MKTFKSALVRAAAMAALCAFMFLASAETADTATSIAAMAGASACAAAIALFDKHIGGSRQMTSKQPKQHPTCL